MKNLIQISVLTSLYKCEQYLEQFFANFLTISNIQYVELIIIHNEPTFQEELIIRRHAPLIPNLTYKKVPLESLYASWNRAIKLSSGNYLAMWNVDDKRTEISLEEQIKVLDRNPECMIVSGDYYKIFNYGDKVGYYKRDPVKKLLLNRIPKCNNGCFLVWRKQLHKKIGYFDEQFKISGDVEFWYRVTSRYKAFSIRSPLGYYLRIDNLGLSKQKSRNDIEHQIIYMRYFNLFMTNIYRLILRKDIMYDMMKMGEKYISIEVKKNLPLRLVPSIILFWVPWVVKCMVNIKYKIWAIYLNKKYNL